MTHFESYMGYTMRIFDLLPFISIASDRTDHRMTRPLFTIMKQ